MLRRTFPQATIPTGPIAGQNPFRLVEATLSYHILGHEISGGKSDAWLGPRMGGAMDLVAGVKKVVVVMEHTAKDEPKLLRKCTLPLTGAKVIDMVITDLGVFSIDKKGPGGMTLLELAPGVTLDEIKTKTQASFKVDPKLKH